MIALTLLLEFSVTSRRYRELSLEVPRKVGRISVPHSGCNSRNGQGCFSQHRSRRAESAVPEVLADRHAHLSLEEPSEVSTAHPAKSRELNRRVVPGPGLVQEIENANKSRIHGLKSFSATNAGSER